MTERTTHQVVAELRKLTATQKKQLADQTQEGSPLQPVVTVQQNAAYVRNTLPVLTEAEALALLAPTAARARVAQSLLQSKIAAFIDQHHDRLEPEFPALLLVLGNFGVQVLDKALREVSKARRGRGAAEVALVDAIMQMQATKAELGADQPNDGKKDQRTLDAYQAALKEFMVQASGDPGATVLGQWTPKDLTLLRECKRHVQKTRPDLADPARSSAASYYGLVERLFRRARVAGMGPITAANAAAERQARREHPNTLYESLDGRGGPKWGGIYPNIQVPTTTRTPTPQQGPLRENSYPVLSPDGQRLLNLYEQQRMFELGGLGGRPPQLDEDLRRYRAELMATPIEQGMWMMHVVKERLESGWEEEEGTTSAPDVSWGGEFGGISINELVTQMQQFHQDKGHDPANPAHQVP